MKTKQPRKQRLARYNAPLHRRRVEMSAPIDNALRLKQEANNVFYPRSMPVRVGDTVIIVRGEGRVKSGEQKGHKISKIDRRKTSHRDILKADQERINQVGLDKAIKKQKGRGSR